MGHVFKEKEWLKVDIDHNLAAYKISIFNNLLGGGDIRGP